MKWYLKKPTGAECLFLVEMYQTCQDVSNHMVLPSGKKGLSIYQWLLKIFLVEILIEVSYPRRPNRTCGENSVVPNHDCCTIFCTWKHCCARIFTVVRSYLAILGEETLLLPWWWTTVEQPSIWHVGVCPPKLGMARINRKSCIWVGSPAGF